MTGALERDRRLPPSRVSRTLTPVHLAVSASTAALVAALLVAGCNPASSPNSATAASPGAATSTVKLAGDPWLDDGKPQAGLPRLKLLLGTKELNTEVCMTREAISKGMMWRTAFPETNAMLFVFGQPLQTAFWMKNVPIDIDVAYLDSEGAILEVHRLEKFNTNPVPSKGPVVQFAVETPVGWFQRHGVQPGTVVRTDRGTLQDVFFSNNRR